MKLFIFLFFIFGIIGLIIYTFIKLAFPFLDYQYAKICKGYENYVKQMKRKKDDVKKEKKNM